jgi:hypothetical protein
MSKIAEHIDDDDLEIDDITDYYLYGDSLDNIESIYYEKQKQKDENIQKTKKFVDYTNKLLEDDDIDFSIKINK